MKDRLFALAGRRPVLADPAATWIAPGAIVVGDVAIGAGVGIWFGAVLRADNEPMRIGDGVNIQDGCVLHSDPGFPLAIGQDATIGHRAIVHGCRIGAGVLVGMGAIVMNGAEIGDNSILGAGALVSERVRIPANSLVVGVPGRVLRELRPAERAAGREAAAQYRARLSEFRRDLRPAGPPA